MGISKKILERNGYKLIRVAFADKLKEEADLMLQTNNFSADVYTQDSQAKSLIRPLMVWWGCQRRYESEGLYWINSVNQKIKDYIAECFVSNLDTDKLVFMISDVRFPNEAKWVHDTWNGKFVHLRRYTSCSGIQHDSFSGKEIGYEKWNLYDTAPNEEEQKQDPLIQELSDYKMEWQNMGNLPLDEAIEVPYLQEKVLKTLNGLKYFNETLS